MNNKYLEKASSILATSAAVHLAQNLTTRQLLKSPKFAKSLGTNFANGVKGIVDTSKVTAAKNFIGGMLSPDSIIAKNSAHKLGSSLAPALKGMDKKQLAALRMASKGKVGPLIRRGLHKDTQVLDIAKSIENHTKMPLHSILSKAEGNVPKIKSMFNDRNLPLLSNIGKNLGKGRASTSATMQPGTLGNKSLLAGSFTSAILDPAAGVLNSVKSLTSTDRFASSKIGSAITNKAHEILLKNPIRKGFQSEGVNKLKNKAYELSVNPVSANLERTSHALKALG